MDTIFAKRIQSGLLCRMFLMETVLSLNWQSVKILLKAGAPLNLFQAQVAYDVYLGDLNHQELVNLKDVQTKLGKYCGLRVGDIEQPNNSAGNWE